MLRQGREGINALGREAREVNAVIGEGSLRTLASTNDSIDRALGSLKTAGAEIAGVLAPAVAGLADDTTRIIRGLRGYEERPRPDDGRVYSEA